MRLQCRACGGIYDDVSADGVRYFHVCPRETILEVELEDAGIVAHPRAFFRGVVLAESDAARRELIAAGVDPKTIGVVLARHDRRRPNHRDENTATRDGAKGEIRVVKAEGDGAIEVATIDATVDR